MFICVQLKTNSIYYNPPCCPPANEGGWDDDIAVEGSLALASQCLAMGGAWTMIHPQTKRLLFLELEFSYAETLQTSWTTFKDLAIAGKHTCAGGDGNDNGGIGKDNATAVDKGNGKGHATVLPAAEQAKGGGKGAKGGGKGAKGGGGPPEGGRTSRG